MPRRFELLPFLFLILFTVYLIFTVNEVKFETHQWLEPTNPIEKNKDFLKDNFSLGKLLIFNIELKHNFFKNPPLHQELKALVNRIENIKEVNSVNSPLHSKIVIRDNSDALNIVKFYEAEEQKVLDEESFEQEFKNSFYWGRLLSKNKKYLNLLVYLNLDSVDDLFLKRKQIIEQIQSNLNQTIYFNDYCICGEVALDDTLDTKSRDNFYTVLSTIAILFVILAFFVYRHWLPVFIIFNGVLLITLVIILIIIKKYDHLNTLTLTLPALIIAIAIADMIHILQRWVQNQHLAKSIFITIKDTWKPCLWTSITSAIGFGVFYFSEIIPLKNYGFSSFFGILLAYPLTYFNVISWLLVFKKIKFKPINIAQSTRFHKALIHKLIASPKRNLILILSSFGLGIFLLNAHTESNFLNVFFEKDSPITQCVNRVDKYMGGSGNIDIILKSENSNEPFKLIEYFNQLSQLVGELKKTDVQYVNSMLKPIHAIHTKITNEQEKYPNSNEALAQEIFFLELSKSENNLGVLYEYTDFNYQYARINMQIDNYSSKEFKSLLNQSILPTLNQNNQLFQQSIITGFDYYFYQLGDYIVSTQFLTFLITALIIAILFFILFGLRLGFIGILVNSLPIVITLSLISFLNLPFDFATVLIASISLGICFDDTAHYFHRFQQEQLVQKNSPIEFILIKTNQEIFQPILFASIILICAFLTLSMSDLVILYRFGIFTALAIFLSLLSVILLQPICLYLIYRK